MAAPITLLLLLVAMVWSWAGGQAAMARLAAAAAASVVATMVLTVVYFLPRNRMLFFVTVETPPGERSRAMVRQWERVNVIRLLIQVPGVAAIMFAVVAA